MNLVLPVKHGKDVVDLGRGRPESAGNPDRGLAVIKIRRLGFAIGSRRKVVDEARGRNERASTRCVARLVWKV